MVKATLIDGAVRTIDGSLARSDLLPKDLHIYDGKYRGGR